MSTDGMFCFRDADPREAHIERKKIERGIQVVVTWPLVENSPTVTYETRCDYLGAVTYRVKFNDTVWAHFEDNFNGEYDEMVFEFRLALRELNAAHFKNEEHDRHERNRKNNLAAAAFFRAEGKL